MTSIDFTTEESVNYILNYSEMLINEMSKKKTRIQDCYKNEQIIILAAMISYYGFENLDTIYKAFEQTYFSDEIFPLESKHDDEIVSAHCMFEAIQCPNNKIEINRTIRFATPPINDSQKIKELVHEINHSVNSSISPICKRNNLLVFRNGIAIYSLDELYKEAVSLEEAINEEQALEIFDIINSFKSYDIKNETLKKDIYKINKKDTIIGYRNLVLDINPLYMNKEFNYVLKNKRLTGDLREIREHFNNKVGRSSAFQELAKEMDNFEKTRNTTIQQSIRNKVYEYVRK